MKFPNPQNKPPFRVEKMQFEEELKRIEEKRRFRQSILSHAVSFGLGVVSGLLVAYLVHVFGWA